MRNACLMLLACAMTAAATFMLTWLVMKRGGISAPRQVSHSHLLTVEKIQALSVLTALKIEVADAQVTRIAGYTGSVKAVLLVKGEVTIGVDLAEAQFQNVKEESRTSVLVLSEPRVQSVRLDHERTKLIGIWQAGLWQIDPNSGEETSAITANLALRDAQRALSSAARDAQLLEQSKRQAENVLKTFFDAVGWEVEIRWR